LLHECLIDAGASGVAGSAWQRPEPQCSHHWLPSNSLSTVTGNNTDSAWL